MIWPAPAKVNLALHITGRRADGYHLLDSLVAFTKIGDVITVSDGPLSLVIDGPFAGKLPATEDNLCLRAARLIGGEGEIRLIKNLPVASGIGGGSADAAAVLRAFAAKGQLMPGDLHRLGADLPVCLASLPARMRGIGDVLDPVPPLPSLSIVLVNPGIAVSTPRVFQALTRTDNDQMPEPDWADADSLIAWLKRCRNDLEPAASTFVPQIGEMLALLRNKGARLARMSGSGATCFGLFDDAIEAQIAADALSQNGWWAVTTELASTAPQG